MFQIIAPIFYGTVNVLGPFDKPLHTELVHQIHKNGNIKGGMYVPSLLDDLCQSSEALEHLKQMDVVCFAGGALSLETGRLISAAALLLTTMGSTETGFPPSLEVSQDDWNYFQFHPSSGIEFHQLTDELYEQVIVKTTSAAEFQSIFYAFPDIKQFITGDLFSRHPKNPNLWTYRGRSDDILVFSNGEKTNPISMELEIRNHPKVNDVLVVGHGKFQSALLIELNLGETAVDEGLVEDTWPLIEKANKSCPGHARIVKPLIMFTKQVKSLARTPKGTIQRRKNYKLYQEEIDELYAKYTLAKINVVDKRQESTIGEDVASIQQFVSQVLQAILEVETFKSNEDIFTLGIDSLKILQAVRSLKSGFSSQRANLIAEAHLYASPTVEKLSLAIATILDSNAASKITFEDRNAREVRLRALLDKYSSTFAPDLSSVNKQLVNNGELFVVLKGSTGSLGSYLLDRILAHTRVAKIYCLNRSSNSKERQIQAASFRKLDTNLSTDRVEFLHGQCGKPSFGLDVEKYKELLEIQLTLYIMPGQSTSILQLNPLNLRIYTESESFWISVQPHLRPFTHSLFQAYLASQTGRWITKVQFPRE